MRQAELALGPRGRDVPIGLKAFMEGLRLQPFNLGLEALSALGYWLGRRS